MIRDKLLLMLIGLLVLLAAAIIATIAIFPSPSEALHAYFGTPLPAQSKAPVDPDNNGWTWIAKDQGGGNIWKKCVGHDLFFEDDYKNDITVVIGGCMGAVGDEVGR